MRPPIDIASLDKEWSGRVLAEVGELVPDMLDTGQMGFELLAAEMW